MKLITTNAALRSHLSRLIKTYPNISFAVAWASSETNVFKELGENKAHIHKAVIGTHFYQTHPGVLDFFTDSKKVKFVLQPKGVFHPKIFMFWNESEWEILIGSANLTAGALNNNSEAMALITDADQDSGMIKEEVSNLIESYWNDAHTVNKGDAIRYRALWLKNQPLLQRLSGEYGQSAEQKPPIESGVMNMTWREFFSSVKGDSHHGYEKRCDLLKVVRTGFESTGEFKSMEIGMRKTIGGYRQPFIHIGVGSEV